MYNNGELSDAVENGEVQVRPLSALSEIKLKNADLLYSGKAIEETILESVDGILKPLDLFSLDIDALLAYIRVVTYGASYSISAIHLDDEGELACAEAKDHNYDVDMNVMIQEIKYLDPTSVDKLRTMKLDDFTIHLEPIRFKDFVTYMQESPKISQLPEEEQFSRLLYDNILNMIIDVDGITDKDVIREWLEKLTAPKLSQISAKISSLGNFGITPTYKVKCIDCGAEFETYVPLNPTRFFSE
jgi:hypothetical protein